MEVKDGGETVVGMENNKNLAARITVLNAKINMKMMQLPNIYWKLIYYLS